MELARLLWILIKCNTIFPPGQVCKQAKFVNDVNDRKGETRYVIVSHLNSILASGERLSI